MTTNKYRLKVTLDENERNRLDLLSSQLRLSRSEILRRLLMNSTLPNLRTFEASQAIRDLLRVNADQARLGNLLKLLIDDETAKTEQLLDDIRATQESLKTAVREIDQSLHKSARSAKALPEKITDHR